MISNFKYKTSIVSFILGVLVTLLMFNTCERKEVAGVIKTETITVTKIDTNEVVITKPIVKYKEKVVIKDNIITVNDTIKIDKDLLQYEYDQVVDDSLRNTRAHIYVKGSGTLDSLNVKMIDIDTTSITNKTQTIYKPNKGLYLGGGYKSPLNGVNGLKPIYSINMDYIHNKWLIGTDIGYGNSPYIGIRAGYKIK